MLKYCYLFLIPFLIAVLLGACSLSSNEPAYIKIALDDSSQETIKAAAPPSDIESYTILVSAPDMEDIEATFPAFTR
jgi:hypothetical protein